MKFDWHTFVAGMITMAIVSIGIIGIKLANSTKPNKDVPVAPAPMEAVKEAGALMSIIEIQRELVRCGHNIKVDGKINTCQPGGSPTLNALDKEICKRRGVESMKRMLK